MTAIFLDHLKPTNHPDIMYFPPPPENFKPLEASDEELAIYGCPPKPPESQGRLRLNRWLRHVSASRIIPGDLRETSYQHGPSGSLAQVPGPSPSPNWSGAAILASNGTFLPPPLVPRSTTSIQFTIPDIYQLHSPRDDCSIWTGYDGYGTSNDFSTDVLQAGVHIVAFPAPKLPSLTIYAWIEWYPNYEIQIQDFLTNPGDAMSIIVSAPVGGAGLGAAYIANLTTGKNVSYTIKPPANTTLLGNCVEWVVERPMLNGQYTSLADFANIYCSGDAYVGNIYYDFVTPNNGEAVSIQMDSQNAGQPSLASPFVFPADTVYHRSEGMVIEWGGAS